MAKLPENQKDSAKKISPRLIQLLKLKLMLQKLPSEKKEPKKS